MKLKEMTEKIFISIFINIIDRDINNIHLFTPLFYRSVCGFILFWLFGCLVFQSTFSVIYWRSYQPGGLLYKQHV